MASFQHNIFSRLLSTIKEADHLVPKIEYLRRLKKVKITGNSRMTDPSEFYSTLASNLESCFWEFDNTLFLEFKFDYINTGSEKWLFHILNRLEGLLENGGMIDVVWKFEADDESIEETGEFLKSKLSIPFALKPVA
jgi:uncharacterized protein YkuJ